ncbi:MAG TPA: hypothetical protein VD971_07580 [Phycisphaerales bacterium]|nr:hypothetical protein [Phycisphaerales bacterium]
MDRLTATIGAGAVALVMGAGVSQAEIVNMTITADNHYSIYSQSAGGGISFVGRNEVGPFGDPGQYNWSLPETWNNINTTTTLYIAAWSDDYFAQGLLAQLSVVGGPTILTGDPQWQVFRTGIDLDDGDPEPGIATVAAQIALATGGNLWRTPSVGQNNTPATVPWNEIPGITQDARWIWANSLAGEDVFSPGADHGEFLLFRVTIPSPGAFAMAGVAGLVALARPRRSAK